MAETLRLEDFAVERQSYTSRPWRIVHVPTGRAVSIPQAATLHDGRVMPFNGPAAFDRKRDATAWVRDELPKLVEAFNSAGVANG